MEATHPVHGNVLIMNDRLYTVAGRSMFTDGGIRFLILDALTGRKIRELVMDDKVPGTDEPLQMRHEILNMPMALSDLLSSNGKKIFMRYQPFDLEGNRLDLMFDGKRYGYEPDTYGPDVKRFMRNSAARRSGEKTPTCSVQQGSWTTVGGIAPIGFTANTRHRATRVTHKRVPKGPRRAHDHVR